MSRKKKAVVTPPAIPLPDEAEPVITVEAPVSWLSRRWLPELLLAAIAVIVWGISVRSGFVFFDDDKAILYNAALRNPSFGQFFSGQNLGMYAPLTWLTYWLGSGFSGQEAWGYHLLGVALHALNSALVFTLFRQLTGRPWAAFAAALLFAVHPVQAEAVCWAAALSTVLFSTFYLGSIWAYMRWLTVDRAGWLALSIGWFSLACLSKSAAVTLPLLLIAIDLYRLGWPRRRYWLAKLPYLAFALYFGLKTFATRAQEGHDIQASSNVFSTFDRFLMVCQTLLFYPVKLLLPLGYSVAYPFVKTAATWPWYYYAAPLALAGLAAFIWLKCRRQPDVLLGLAWYVLPLAVMLPFRTVGSFELRSDRYVYLSCTGLFFLFALLLEHLSFRLRNISLIAIGLGLSVLAFRQTFVWRDGVALFENCVSKTPESSLCQCNLAYNDLITNDYQSSIAHYSTALKYDPNTIEAYNGRGQAYFALRKIPEALADFNQAIETGIVTPKLFLNQGKCLVILGRPAEALPALSRSLELEARNPETWYFRAVAEEKTNALEKALADYSQAISLNARYVEALVNRGMLYFNAKNYQEAVADNTTALQVAVQSVQPMILGNRANAYLLLGQLEPALADVNKAIALNANDIRLYQTRASIYRTTGPAVALQADLQKIVQLQQAQNR